MVQWRYKEGAIWIFAMLSQLDLLATFVYNTIYQAQSQCTIARASDFTQF